MKKIFLNLIKTFAIISVFTFLSVIFRSSGFHEANIIIVFVLAVLFVSKFTEGYIFGIIGSILGVLFFNFFFTEPYYSLRTYRDDYPLTFLIMLVVAIITSTQTTKIKKEIEKSLEREKNIKILYNLNKGLLQVKSKKEILEFSAKSISEIFKRSVKIVTVDENDNIEDEFIQSYEDDININLFKISSEEKKVKDLINNSKKTVHESNLIKDEFINYYPIAKNNKCLGVLGISCLDKKSLNIDEENSLNAVINLITMAIDKENIYEKQKYVMLEVEKERLRANLLRSISHDLRTPLTSIVGSVSTIINNNNVLPENIKNELLQNIYDDAHWLINSSENILSITRIEDGNFSINKNLELLEDIVSEIVIRTKEILKNHKFYLEMPKEDIFIKVDIILIIQLLFNLIENAVKYTPSNSEIKLKIEKKKNFVCFEVEDNGGGIPENELEKIFDRFYRSNRNSNEEKRGLGLGLAICKSIAKAHGGTLSAFNNINGGATFKLELIAERERNEH